MEKWQWHDVMCQKDDYGILTHVTYEVKFCPNSQYQDIFDYLYVRIDVENYTISYKFQRNTEEMSRRWRGFPYAMVVSNDCEILTLQLQDIIDAILNIHYSRLWEDVATKGLVKKERKKR